MFTLEITKQRYRATLDAMEPAKLARAGDAWERAAIGLFFAERERAILSVRDTLAGLLLADQRVLDNQIRNDLFDSIALEQFAGDVARQIHLTYSASTPLD